MSINILHIKTNRKTDTDGHFVSFKGFLNSIKITTANTYRSNDEPSLFPLIQTSYCFSDSVIIIGGVFNTVLSPHISRSSTKNNHKPWHSTKIIRKYMQDLGFGDCWGSKNLSSNEHSYFSTSHKSFFGKITP